MKMMIDTNVILDILERREPYFENSYGALRKALREGADCFISASAVTDIFYLLRKYFRSSREAKKRIEMLSHVVVFADVTGMDIHTALARDMGDFEDAVVDAVAARYGADCILTRNVRDFEGSAVPAVAPSAFRSS